MLYVERSNRTERLLASLARRRQAWRRDPLEPSIVVVQGQGMERWIAQSLADEHGVCANTRFLFPKNLLERVFASCPVAEWAEPDRRWEPERLTWWVAQRIASHRDAPELAPLVPHLEAADGDWRLVQLARQIADLFDRYINDRPERVIGWALNETISSDRDERWQASLFRGLVEDLGESHLARRAHDFVTRMLGEDAEPFARGLRTHFPARIEVFAVSTLSPLYLRVLGGLARAIDVHLSVLSPSRHFVGELWREVRDAESALAVAPADGVFPEKEEPLGTATGAIAGLLAGLGRLGADFQSCLEEISGYQENEADLFEDPTDGESEPTLLERLQRGLLDLEDGDAGAPIARDDDSIRIHACHGATRELEAVEAALWEAFDRDPTLTPEDVIVMAPDIDAIAPSIEAVFAPAREGAAAIPYRIADRGTLRRSPVAEAFVALLELLTGRAGRSEVIDWLAREPVRERFGLEAEAIESLVDWAERAGVRFGLDEDHRASLGLVAERSHTWSGGLDRLALAHAMGAGDRVCEGVIPVPLGAFGEASWLGALGELESLLSAARRTAERGRSVTEWCHWLMRLLEDSIQRVDANVHEHAALRKALLETAEAAEAAGFDAAIPFEAIRERIRRALESTRPAQGFLSGGVTFCELVPLRAIPFRVIAIVGLGDEVFPRGGPAAGYDLIARHPRPGDRSPRSDDRHLFLEALLSARDRLILTWPGRDLRDGTERPPSVVVAELLDALEACFDLAPPEARCASGEGDEEAVSEIEALRQWLVVRHPLQAFSPRYFVQGAHRDDRLVGRGMDAFRGARARWEAWAAGGGALRRFLPQESEATHASPASVDERPHLMLDRFCDRILRPSRHFVRETLGLRLPRNEDAVVESDPIRFETLDRYRLGQVLIDHYEAGTSLEEAERKLAANPLAPPGLVGGLATRELREELETILSLARSRRSGAALADQPFELDLEGAGGLGPVRLSGTLGALWPAGRICLGFTRIGARSEHDLWIRHLVLCALVEQGLETSATSMLIARPAAGGRRERIVSFGPVSDPQIHLARLFEWAWSLDRAPLPFFPRSARRYAESLESRGARGAKREAYGVFLGRSASEFQRDELEEDYESQRLWEGTRPLETDAALPVRFHFDELATAFFEPLLAARQELPE
ncbi:MAG: exodeoxyribonuclease V subunit gamma [Deltaproteobacteria bacterium]|nr:exodeoxyribonuclease V subunit gamma [Deltaproteobacteria bacterium]